jgi:hypothetical protein
MLESELTIMIIQAFNKEKAMSKKQVPELIRERYSAGLTQGWLNAFVRRQLDALRIYCCLPQEDVCLTVPRQHIKHTLSTSNQLRRESSPSSSSI